MNQLLFDEDQGTLPTTASLPTVQSSAHWWRQTIAWKRRSASLGDKQVCGNSTSRADRHAVGRLYVVLNLPLFVVEERSLAEDLEV